MTVYTNYYAFYFIDGVPQLKKPIKFVNESLACRTIRKETKVHLTAYGNAHWSVHLPSGKAIAAGGWKNGVRFCVHPSQLHSYDCPELE